MEEYDLRFDYIIRTLSIKLWFLSHAFMTAVILHIVVIAECHFSLVCGIYILLYSGLTGGGQHW